MRVIIDGKSYDHNDKRIYQDCFDGTYYLYDALSTNQIASGFSRINISSIEPEIIDFVITTLKYKNYLPPESIKELMEDKANWVNTNGNTNLFIISKEKLKEWGFINGITNPDIYYHKNQIHLYDKPMQYRKFDNTISIEKLNVDLKLNKITPSEYKSKASKAGIISPTYIELENYKYPYGIEIETVEGHLTEKECTGLNFKAVHDGSLRGPNGEEPLGGEYVTGILVGDTGLSQLYDICKLLKSKCKIDQRAGVHIHIGGFENSTENVVYAYLLGVMMEKHFNRMLPKTRRNNSYCRPLEKLFSSEQIADFAKAKGIEYDSLLSKMYEDIFRYVSFDGRKNYSPSREFNKLNQHPKGAKCGYIKETQRYCWLNFVTFIFNTRGNQSYSLEIRNHSATLNYRKIKNWLKIFMAFVALVDNHKQFIKDNLTNSSFNLEDIINRVYKKSPDKLVKYIREREALFSIKSESVEYIDEEVFDKKSVKQLVTGGQV